MALVKNMFPEKDAEKEVQTPDFFAKLQNWFRSKMGTINDSPPVTPEQLTVKLYRYRVNIYTGAGVVKTSIDAANKKEAEERALVNYVGRLNVKAELVG